MNQIRRTSSLGCLGVFSVLCMFTCTGLNVGTLWFLNPDWLDRNAPWRSEIYPREEITPEMVQAGFAEGGAPTTFYSGVDADHLTAEPLEAPEAERKFVGPGGALVELPRAVLPGETAPKATPMAAALADVPDDVAVVSMLDLQPDGMTFAQPVRVVFPLGEAVAPGEALDVIYHGPNGWQSEGVVARALADGMTAEAWLTHFSQPALKKKDWDPDIIKTMQIMGLMGIERARLAMEQVTAGGLLTQRQIDMIKGAKTSEAISLHDKMYGWVEHASPTFNNFLMMVKLAKDRDQKSFMHFAGPSKDWVIEKYFTPDPREPELKDEWQERYDETKSNLAPFKVVWDVFWDKQKEKLKKKYGVNSAQELLDKLVKGHMTKEAKAAEERKRKNAEIVLSPGRFIYNNDNLTVRHPNRSELVMNVDSFAGAESGESGRTLVPKNIRRMGDTLRQWVMQWESGAFGNEVSAEDFEGLALALPTRTVANFTRSSDPVERRVEAYCQRLALDLRNAYWEPTRARWRPYHQPRYPLPGATQLGPTARGVGEPGSRRDRTREPGKLVFNLTLHRTVVATTALLASNKLEEHQYLRVRVPDGYGVEVGVTKPTDKSFDRLKHKVFPAKRVAPRENKPFLMNIRVWSNDATLESDYPRAVPVTVTVETEDPFEGRWSGWVNLVEGTAAEPINSVVDGYVAHIETEAQDHIADARDYNERQRRQQEWDTQKTEFVDPVADTIKTLLTQAEVVLRFPGAPLEFEIRKDESQPGTYYFRLTKAAWQAMDGEDITVKQVGKHALAFPMEAGAKVEPLIIRLHRHEEIRDHYTIDQMLQTNERIYCKLRWTFERIEVVLDDPTGPIDAGGHGP